MALFLQQLQLLLLAGAINLESFFLGGQSGTLKRIGRTSTKEHPLDFRFHQRQLSKAESARVWDWLRRNLNDEEFALIERYLPKQSAPAVSTWE